MEPVAIQANSCLTPHAMLCVATFAAAVPTLLIAHYKLPPFLLETACDNNSACAGYMATADATQSWLLTRSPAASYGTVALYMNKLVSCESPLRVCVCKNRMIESRNQCINITPKLAIRRSDITELRPIYCVPKTRLGLPIILILGTAKCALPGKFTGRPGWFSSILCFIVVPPASLVLTYNNTVQIVTCCMHQALYPIIHKLLSKSSWTVLACALRIRNIGYVRIYCIILIVYLRRTPKRGANVCG